MINLLLYSLNFQFEIWLRGPISYRDDREMGPRSSFYSLAGKSCEEPSEQPDNGELVCNSIGDFLYCSIKCNSNKQLFKYSFGSSCNPSSLKWSPEEVLIACVGQHKITKLNYCTCDHDNTLKFFVSSKSSIIQVCGKGDGMNISKKNNFMTRQQIILRYNTYPNHPISS